MQAAESNSHDMVNQMLRTRTYPWNPDSVELIETHISWVFLAGDRVVKVKRPVNYGFVDHRELDVRRQSCIAEVQLNRRLTTGVYLSVEPITHTAGAFRLGGDGPVAEWATVMRRLPGDRMLDILLESGSAPADLATRLTDRLLPFHREIAEPCGDLACGRPDALLGVVTENLDQLADFAGSIVNPLQLSLVDSKMRAFSDEHRSNLAKRAADGWVRDGHGDLRIEHVCLETDGSVQIFDCVEFSAAIRCADVASDLAFLLMDLERVGAGEVANDVLERYRAASADLPQAIVDFYRSHRSVVRAKVACLTAAAAGHESHATAPAEAADYLNLATRFSVNVSPALVAMTGLSGTGKSTVARAIARATGAPIFSSDDVRKRLAGIEGSAAADWQQGIYGPEWTELTYDRLIEEASNALTGGKPAILDATFIDQSQRRRVTEAAARHGVPAVFVETTCDDAVAVARILARQKLGTSRSDAGVETYGRQKEHAVMSGRQFPEGGLVVQIDTTRDGPVDLDPLLSVLESNQLLTSRLLGDS
jgi:aminoglycoside phosphotransferase family enzyme/predicted kinase